MFGVSQPMFRVKRKHRCSCCEGRNNGTAFHASTNCDNEKWVVVTTLYRHLNIQASPSVWTKWLWLQEEPEVRLAKAELTCEISFTWSEGLDLLSSAVVFSWLRRYRTKCNLSIVLAVKNIFDRLVSECNELLQPCLTSITLRVPINYFL